MRGTLPRLEGREPHYPTCALQGVLSTHVQADKLAVAMSRSLADNNRLMEAQGVDVGPGSGEPSS